jgi:hypothetical protein
MSDLVERIAIAAFVFLAIMFTGHLANIELRQQALYEQEGN